MKFVINSFQEDNNEAIEKLKQLGFKITIDNPEDSDVACEYVCKNFFDCLQQVEQLEVNKLPAVITIKLEHHEGFADSTQELFYSISNFRKELEGVL